MNPLSGVLLDTNVVSYLFEQSPLGVYYECQRADRVCYVSCVTSEELYFGAEKRKWGNRKRGALDAFISEYIVLPADFDLSKITARLRAERERAGRRLSNADAWIAATALDYSLALFTHDQDFEGILGLHTVTAPPVSRGRTDHDRELPANDASLEAASFAESIYLLQ
jgi:predicted nucleic acid-binding protein